MKDDFNYIPWQVFNVRIEQLRKKPRGRNPDFVFPDTPNHLLARSLIP